MKQLFVSMLILLFGVYSFSAPIEKPLLWKVEKDGNVAYVFGTFHLGFSKGDLPDGFLSYIDSSEFFFMEADLSKVDQSVFLQKATFSGGQTLDMFLPEDSWQKLVEQLSVVPEEQLKNFKPWYIVNGLVTQLALSQLELSGTIDTELLEYALEKGVSVDFLEDTLLQLSILEAITPSHALDEALRASDNLVEASKEELTGLYDCYLTSNIPCLTGKLGTEGEGGSMKDWQYDLLLKQRNITWIPTIEESMKKGLTFVAVGAGHLVGKDSVLKLLREKGYTAELVY